MSFWPLNGCLHWTHWQLWRSQIEWKCIPESLPFFSMIRDFLSADILTAKDPASALHCPLDCTSPWDVLYRTKHMLEIGGMRDKLRLLKFKGSLWVTCLTADNAIFCVIFQHPCDTLKQNYSWYIIIYPVRDILENNLSEIWGEHHLLTDLYRQARLSIWDSRRLKLYSVFIQHSIFFNLI